MKNRLSLAISELKDNLEQRKALEHAGNCVLLAGPGTGKTQVMITKLAVMAETVSPGRKIACLTYSNQCVKELRNRVSLISPIALRSCFVGTVHSFCFQEIFRPFYELVTSKNPYEFRIPPKSVIDKIGLESIESIFPFREDIKWKEIQLFRRINILRETKDWHNNVLERPIIEEYEKRIEAQGLIDYDSIVLISLQLVKKHNWVRKILKAKFPALFVDEYQDLGAALHELVEELCFEEGIQLFAAGDPHQSIYAFNGSNPRLLEELANRENVTAIRLRKSYRWNPKSVNPLNGLEIACEDQVNKLDLRAFAERCNVYQCPKGHPEQIERIFTSIIPNLLDKRILPGEIGVLYQDKYQGNRLAEVAQKIGQKFCRFDKEGWYIRTRITDFLEICAKWSTGDENSCGLGLNQIFNDWQKLCNNWREDSENVLNQKICNFLFQGRNQKFSLGEWLTLFRQSEAFNDLASNFEIEDDLKEFEIFLESVSKKGALSSFTLEEFGKMGGDKEYLNLSTIHSSKGLEYRTVIIPFLDQGFFPRTYNSTLQDIHERRRLFHVAISRAKSDIHLLWSGHYENQYGRRFTYGPSIFLTEMGLTLE